MQTSIVDSPSACELPTRGDIVLREVRYAYPDESLDKGRHKQDKVQYRLEPSAKKGREILKGINLRVQAGERVAIIGRSGAGKTSILNLMLRLADPSAGELSYGGVKLRDARIAQIHQRISLLAQDAPVFLGTIRSNLLIGDAKASDERLWQALDSARLGDFVRSLANGLDTWTGETGRTLSAGQARRLCLARALLSPAQVLLLDEPTQGLDREAEQAFLEDLLVATQGRTVIMVTHAALPVDAVERVYRLEAGQLVLVDG